MLLKAFSYPGVPNDQRRSEWPSFNLAYNMVGEVTQISFEGKTMSSDSRNFPWSTGFNGGPIGRTEL